MSPCTGFQSNLGGRHLGKEGFNLRPSKLAAKNNAVVFIYAVQRQNMLRRIDRYTFKFHWDGPFMMVSCATSSWHNPMPWAVPPQQISMQINKYGRNAALSRNVTGA
jgi:hypothetical protein